MNYFISIDGKVYADNYRNKDKERLDLSWLSMNNIFHHRESAHLFRHILDERYPRLFYEQRHSKTEPSGG